MSRIERVLAMVAFIVNSENGVYKRQIIKKFGISKSQFYRDILIVMSSNFEIRRGLKVGESFYFQKDKHDGTDEFSDEKVIAEEVERRKTEKEMKKMDRDHIRAIERRISELRHENKNSRSARDYGVFDMY